MKICTNRIQEIDIKYLYEYKLLWDDFIRNFIRSLRFFLDNLIYKDKAWVKIEAKIIENHFDHYKIKTLNQVSKKILKDRMRLNKL